MITPLEFVEAPVFTRLVAEYISDDDYCELQLHLARDPEAGEVIPGTGGFRKLRWDDRRRRRGKRGGLRVVYYYFSDDAQLWFVTIYRKSEVADISPDEKRALKAAVDRELGQRRRTREARGQR